MYSLKYRPVGCGCAACGDDVLAAVALGNHAGYCRFHDVGVSAWIHAVGVVDLHPQGVFGKDDCSRMSPDKGCRSWPLCHLVAVHRFPISLTKDPQHTINLGVARIRASAKKLRHVCRISRLSRPHETEAHHGRELRAVGNGFGGNADASLGIDIGEFEVFHRWFRVKQGRGSGRSTRGKSLVTLVIC